MKNQISSLCLFVCLGLSTSTVAILTGCSSNSNNQSERTTGQYIDDQTLTLRVHGALSDNPDYKFSDVNVNVMQGTVQLSGFVDTSDQKAKAVEISKSVQGVKDVEDKISVKPSQ